AGNNTMYYTAEVMPADLPRALEIFGEVVLAPTFPADELAKLKPQVIAEIQQVDNSWARQAQRLFRSVFYQKSPYRRISLGGEAAVQSLTGEQLAAFHKTAVVGSRAVLAVFGDIDPAAAENLIRRQFEAFPKGEPLAVETLELDAAGAEERRVVEKSAKTGAYVYVGFPGLKQTSIPQRYPLEVLTEIVGSYTSANWLFDTLRGARLVYAAGGANFMGVLPGYFAATAQCEPDKAAEALQIMRTLLAKAARGEITPEEVARAKSSLINREAMAYQTNADQASAAALDELLGMGFDWWRGNTERIMAVDHAQVLALAKQILSAPPTVVILTSQPELFSAAKDEPK
ncbi:MAG: insulinase family protein, partial [Sedimentisphaerales bacterium]|nr:insulinase family protein [Sedimentisphaerales bacterium]